MFKRTLLAVLFFVCTTSNKLFSQMWNASSTEYSTSYSFDANGNISSINRNAYGSNNAMDKLDYYYNTDKNQLNYVTDEENVKFTTDLNTQTSNNYEYDKLGRLIKDAANGIDLIEYTIFNKPFKIYKSNGDVIQYLYDGSSNKVAQNITSSTGEENITYYTLTNTAQLNGVYCSDGSNITLAESHISDLVTLTRNENIKTPRISSKVFTRLIHYKNYPLHDHLGSVRVLLSDHKTSEAEVSIVEESTYYPYGMQVPGMSYQTENSRFGFQGKEVLTAMTAAGGSHLDFGARINDVRIAQWTSVDPLEAKFPSVSPYNSMGNNPINFIDPDGREAWKVQRQWNKDDIDKFGEYMIKAIEIYRKNEIKLDCADLQVALITMYAYENGLPISFHTDKDSDYKGGVLSSTDDLSKYNIDVQKNDSPVTAFAFLKLAKMMTNANSIRHDMTPIFTNDVEQLTDDDVIKKMKAGDIKNTSHHVNVYTGTFKKLKGSPTFLMFVGGNAGGPRDANGVFAGVVPENEAEFIFTKDTQASKDNFNAFNILTLENMYRWNVLYFEEE